MYVFFFFSKIKLQDNLKSHSHINVQPLYECCALMRIIVAMVVIIVFTELVEVDVFHIFVQRFGTRWVNTQHPMTKVLICSCIKALIRIGLVLPSIFHILLLFFHFLPTVID